MILGIAFLLMVSLVFDAVLQGLGKLWGTGALEAFAQALNLVAGSAVASSFGAAGSLVVVMIWVYYSARSSPGSTPIRTARAAASRGPALRSTR